MDHIGHGGKCDSKKNVVRNESGTTFSVLTTQANAFPFHQAR